MSATTINLEMDTEQMRKIFGMQDAYIKKLEQDFQVTIVDRNGSIIITGEEENTGKASRVLRQLTALSDRGNDGQGGSGRQTHGNGCRLYLSYDQR